MATTYAEARRERREFLRSVLIMASEAAGYTVYEHGDMNSDFYYGFIITPSENILYVQNGDWGGVQFSLQYKPSRKNGTGCRCLQDDPFYKVNMEIIRNAEGDGLHFAHQLGATLYSEAQEWINTYWNFNSLRKINPICAGCKHYADCGDPDRWDFCMEYDGN